MSNESFFFVVRLGIIYYLKNKFVIGKEFSFIINKSIRKIIDLMKNRSGISNVQQALVETLV